MKDKRVSFIFFILIIGLSILAYFPTLKGSPIWDDNFFWFSDPVMKEGFSFLTIWKDFNWPLSVSLQKVLLSWFGQNFIYYHLINFSLHLTNAFLFYKILKIFKVPYSFLGFALFLLHPANMISVAWMTQIKTLLCLLFALLSLLAFKRSEQKTKFIFLSYLFFLLSLLSKSASIPLGPVLFIMGLKQFDRKKIGFLIPFLLLSFYSSYRLIKSPVTQATLQKINLEKKSETPTPQAQGENRAQKPPVSEESHVPVVKPPSKPILQILHYYFWQSILPVKTHPVHSRRPPALEALHFVHLIFLILLFVLCWKKQSFWNLIFAHLMLIPFAGIIFAPFMKVTWISDQHLYLALPFFIACWLFLFNQAPLYRSIKVFVAVALISFYVYKLYQSSSIYKNEISFFKASLEEDNLNLPIVYNLSVAYYLAGNKPKAIETIKNFLILSQYYPEIKKDESFTGLLYLFFKLQGKNS
jgi:hypothetical protein